MHALSAVPGDIINQIVSNRDTSYVVIRLWLCGDKRLNNKLSKCVTLIDLKRHPLSTCSFPRIVFGLPSLRHLSLYSLDELANQAQDWSVMMKSLPNTLESLSIHSADWDHSLMDSSSDAIDLGALFPRLHTLKIGPSTTTYGQQALSQLPPLPSSLTYLEAPLGRPFISSTTDLLPQLPPNIVSLCGPTSWRPLKEGDTIDSVVRGFQSVPASLQVLSTPYAQAWTTDEVFEWSDAKINDVQSFWSRFEESHLPFWSPSLAQAMPPNLQSLALSSFSTQSFRGSDWVVTLPRTLTNFTTFNGFFCTLDFVRYAASLPPNLVTLTLCNNDSFTKDPFGDWNDIQVSNNVWPSTLRTLVMKDFWIEPRAITNLPATLERLYVSFSTSHETFSTRQPVVETSKLPPNLTSLNLGWTNNVELDLNLRNFNIKACALSFMDSNTAMGAGKISRLPDSLTTLHLTDIGLDRTFDIWFGGIFYLPPNLTRLHVYEINIEMFEHLPRSLQFLQVDYLSGILESSLLAEGHLFMHLPTSTRHFNVLEKSQDLDSGFELGPQRFDHLPLLRSLNLSCAPRVSSKLFRNLPRALANLKLGHLILDEDDLPYLPPHLESFYADGLAPSLVAYMSLRSLACLTGGDLRLETLARKRIQQASVHQ